jgi:hypothetical protein
MPEKGVQGRKYIAIYIIVLGMQNRRKGMQEKREFQYQGVYEEY